MRERRLWWRVPLRVVAGLLVLCIAAWAVFIVMWIGIFWVSDYSYRWQYSGTFIDMRDGKKYKTIKMPDGKTWMAENLNHQSQAGNSWCYNDKNSNSDTYGWLYDWNTAKTVCPAGWHLPSRQEWDGLVTAVGGRNSADKLKSQYGALNDYGFSAKLGGVRETDGSFNSAGQYGFWWTATERTDSLAHDQYMGYDSDIADGGYGAKGDGMSVRCVADAK